ncbi:hypothetical protein C7447_10569 [Tenacibaculum adriaticum]|uniref:Uncharacterized protein n=1 Tax=Tenacibaculum adriaticum TaxID=413713 RepID=A0A5S5DPW0_9FLAO|nr:hypothetical protein [Tenacibaculum adriaticum]TYP97056.1 hypothetical protein C7447_10569 [Tenacibaculum adriaticum]
MKIEQNSEYIFISSDENSFEDFAANFKEKHSEIKEKHVIVSISANLNIVEKDIFVFLDYAELHQQNGTTFVLVCPRVDVDNFPETFNIVPTLQEAEDILEMENIQRDLGF